MSSLTVAKAPAKLILSGEHAVLHGAPALTCAIPQYVTVTCQTSHDNSCLVAVPSLNWRAAYTMDALNALRANIDYRHQQFSAGKLNISAVLSEPIELFLYTCALFFSHYHLNPNVNITLESEIPLGCGMGSSAASVVALLIGLYHHYRINVDDDMLLSFAQQAEDKQHGRSSGIDIYTSYYGRSWYFHDRQPTAFTLARNLPIYWSNTGRPQQSTGACVAHTSKNLNQSILAQFARVTSTMKSALIESNFDLLFQSVQDNQQLLNQIGATPTAVQHKLAQLSTNGIAAKISGAGALAGSCAGCIIMVSQSPPSSDLLNNYQPLSLCNRGAHVCD